MNKLVLIFNLQDGSESLLLKTNTFSLHNVTFECSADMREKVIEARFEAINKQKVIVYYKEKRIGPAHIVNLHLNATLKREFKKNKNHFPKDKK